MRVLLDPNVFISALVTPSGIPAQILRAWSEGHFELLVSNAVIDEMERVLAYPKLKKRISQDDAIGFMSWLRQEALLVDDSPGPPPVKSVDPDDDYLIAIAADNHLALISGDAHLLELSRRMPVFSPREFLELLEV